MAIRLGEGGERCGKPEGETEVGQTAFAVKPCLSYMTSTLHDDKCLPLLPLAKSATNQSGGMQGAF